MVPGFSADSFQYAAFMLARFHVSGMWDEVEAPIEDVRRWSEPDPEGEERPVEEP